MATAQLQLISTDQTWKLDVRTVEIGRAGIAQARAALASAETVDNPLDATYAESKAASYRTSMSQTGKTKTSTRKNSKRTNKSHGQQVQQQQIVLAA